MPLVTVCGRVLNLVTRGGIEPIGLEATGGRSAIPPRPRALHYARSRGAYASISAVLPGNVLSMPNSMRDLLVRSVQVTEEGLDWMRERLHNIEIALASPPVEWDRTPQMNPILLALIEE